MPLAATTGIAPGTEAGSQLFTTGIAAGRVGVLGVGDALWGGAVIFEAGEGLTVGVVPGAVGSRQAGGGRHRRRRAGAGARGGAASDCQQHGDAGCGDRRHATTARVGRCSPLLQPTG